MNKAAVLAGLSAILALAGCGGGGSGGGGSGPLPDPLNTVLIQGAPTLMLSIGSGQSSASDTLSVAGAATLSGNLKVVFNNGYVPSSGQSFTVVSAAKGVTGHFDAVNTQGVPVTISYAPTMVTITVK